jgi:hypothetical protein
MKKEIPDHLRVVEGGLSPTRPQLSQSSPPINLRTAAGFLAYTDRIAQLSRERMKREIAAYNAGVRPLTQS